MKVLAIVLVAVAAGIAWRPVHAQQANAPNKSSTYNREQLRAQSNENAIFLMGGPLEQSDIAYATDIASVVNDGLNLRVLPVVGAAAVQSVKDVLLLRGVDLAITDAATLAEMRRSEDAGPALERQIAYVSVLYTQEVHILARPGIGSIQELAGKNVNFDIVGTGSAMHIPRMFEKLRIETKQSNVSQIDAVEKMQRGELDATTCICVIPVAAFQNLAMEYGFRFLSVPYDSAPLGDFLPAKISADDYPNLITPDAAVETSATTSVLISFNWRPDSPRYARTAKFVDAFFSRFSNLLRPPRQPGWRTVNLAAKLPGWERFAPAEAWLADDDRVRRSDIQSEFKKFSAERGLQGDAALPDQSNALFREFLQQRSRSIN
jgi:TRAP-type uncharacterized transport system substrate-binding protein